MVTIAILVNKCIFYTEPDRCNFTSVTDQSQKVQLNIIQFDPIQNKFFSTFIRLKLVTFLTRINQPIILIRVVIRKYVFRKLLDFSKFRNQLRKTGFRNRILKKCAIFRFRFIR